jgi:hypothetical protein
VVFLDPTMVKVRDNHVVQNKPAYLAIGIDADGEKHDAARRAPSTQAVRDEQLKAAISRSTRTTVASTGPARSGWR